MEEKKPESQPELEKQEATSKEKTAPEHTSGKQPDQDAVAEPVPEVEEPAALTPEELLAESQKEIEKNRDLYLRARADLENYRKRVQREKEDLVRFGNENIIRELLPVLDNLERAVEHARSENNESQGLLEGVEMTISQFQKALEKFGARTFSALGEAFDPGRHEPWDRSKPKINRPTRWFRNCKKAACLTTAFYVRPWSWFPGRRKKNPVRILKKTEEVII